MRIVSFDRSRGGPVSRVVRKDWGRRRLERVKGIEPSS
jgi:hypothetical protein